MDKISLYKEVYDKYKNLKLAAAELGIKWQSLYSILSEIGHPVVGDKAIYGSLTDKLARYTEEIFNNIVPNAIDLNMSKFQSKLDFIIRDYKVDVKASTKKDGYKNNPIKNPFYRWAFSCKVQENTADFLVCFCYEGYDTECHGEVEKILLIPKEFFINKQSISVSCNNSKWYDFEVTEDELREFFE